MTDSPAAKPSTRWNLVISEPTNIAVRSFLAQRGGKKGDLSNFVEEAVRWRLFDLMLTQAREGFDGFPAPEAENLLDEALAHVRNEGLAAGRYAAFMPAPTMPTVATRSRAAITKPVAKKPR
jgi:Ribbon-helix-helix domain